MSRIERENRTENFNHLVLMISHYFAGYITVENAQRITGYSNLGAKKALKNLAKNKYFIEDKVLVKGTFYLIYRITKYGRESIGEYSEYENENPFYETFISSRFREGTFRHEMLVQRLAHQLSKSLDTDFFKARVLGGSKNKKGQIVGGRRADAQFFYDDREAFLEVELTMKSRQRYKDIFRIYNENNAVVFWAIYEKKINVFEKIQDELLTTEEKSSHEIIVIGEDE